MKIAKSVIRFFRDILLSLLCILQYSGNGVKGNMSPNRIRRILIYGNMGLGNMVLFSPTIRAIRSHFRNAHIALLVGNDTGCQEVVDGSELVDETIKFGFSHAGIRGKLSFCRWLRKRHFDLLVSDFHGASPFITIAVNAPYRVGHVTSPGWSYKYSFVYNYKVRMGRDEHEIDRDLRLAYAVGIAQEDADKKPVFWLDKGDREYAAEFWNQNGIQKADSVISVQMGTSPTMRWKQWNLDKFRELCDRILDLPNTIVILHGSPGEKEMVADVVRRMDSEPIVVAGETTIKQAAAIIERSDMLVCNDSGLMHIAVAVDTPVIAIYGPTDYMRTASLGKMHKIIRKGLSCSPCFKMDGAEEVENCPYDYACLGSISVDEVFEKTLGRLQTAGIEEGKKERIE